MKILTGFVTALGWLVLSVLVFCVLLWVGAIIYHAWLRFRRRILLRQERGKAAHHCPMTDIPQGWVRLPQGALILDGDMYYDYEYKTWRETSFPNTIVQNGFTYIRRYEVPNPAVHGDQGRHPGNYKEEKQDHPLPVKDAFEELWSNAGFTGIIIEAAARKFYNAATEAERKRFADGVEKIINKDRTFPTFAWSDVKADLRKLAKGEG
jgi:hypothetical protein